MMSPSQKNITFWLFLFIAFCGSAWLYPRAKQLAIRINLFRYHPIESSPIFHEITLCKDMASRANNVRLKVSRLLMTGRHLVARQPYLALQGQDNWLLYAEGLHSCLASPSLFTQCIEPITSFAEQCTSVGLDLYVIPIPPKWQTHPESVGASAQDSIYPHRDYLIRKLRAEGVKTIDLAPVFAKERKTRPELLLYYKANTHWTSEAARIAAQAIVKKINLPRDQNARDFRSKNRPTFRNIVIENGLEKTLPKPEAYQARRLYPARIFPQNSHEINSRVLILGDSYSFPTLCAAEQPDGTKVHNGLPAQLSYELGEPVGLIASAGGATRYSLSTFARRFHESPELAETLRTILWVFDDRTFIYGAPGFTSITLSSKPSTQEISPLGETPRSRQAFLIARSNTTGIMNSVYKDAFEVMVFSDSLKHQSTEKLFLVFRPAKVNGEVIPEESYTLKQRYRLELTRWTDVITHKSGISHAQIYDDSNIFDSECFLLNSIKPVNQN